jgi:hypothetical protein
MLTIPPVDSKFYPVPQPILLSKPPTKNIQLPFRSLRACRVLRYILPSPEELKTFGVRWRSWIAISRVVPDLLLHTVIADFMNGCLSWSPCCRRNIAFVFCQCRRKLTLIVYSWPQFRDEESEVVLGHCICGVLLRVLPIETGCRRYRSLPLCRKGSLEPVFCFLSVFCAPMQRNAVARSTQS